MELRKENLKLKQLKKREQYIALAELFRYPKTGYQQKIRDCAELLKAQYPVAHVTLIPFLDVIINQGLYETEELFSKTFHIQAICYLDLGYVLFAEDYKRGAFLVHMKNEQQKINNDCAEELADNLPNVLTLMAQLEDASFLDEMAVRIVIPALENMLKEFDMARMTLKTEIRRKKQKVLIQENLKNKNIYQYAIQSTLDVLKEDFKESKYQNEFVKPDLSSSFLPGCGTCQESPLTNQTN